MGRVGRPRVLDATKKKVIVEALERGLSRTLAGKLVGCSRAAIIAEAKRDEEFATGLQAADANGQNKLVGKLQELALKGNVYALTWLIERRWHKRWGPPPRRIIEQKADAVDLNVREDGG